MEILSLCRTFKLNNGWVAIKDPSQNKYYYSKDGGAPTWEWPEDAGPKPEVASDSWAFTKDPTSQKVYYYSTTDKSKTEWQPPASVIEAAFGGDGKKAEAAAAAPKPAAAAAAVESKAPAAATGGGGAARRSGGGGSMETRVRLQWFKLLENVKEEATIALKARRSRFERLRQIRAKKAREELEREKKEAEEAKAEAEEMAKAAEEARKLTIVSMTELPAPDSVPRMAMEDYVRDNCELKRKGIFKGETTVEKLMRYKKSEIKMPLRKFADAAATERATQMNRNILSFMGDRSSSKDEGGHAEKLLKTLIINKVSDFNDEAYLQLTKQTTDNPNPDSLIKGWQLFGILTGAVLPSDELLPYVRSYFYEAVDNNEPGEPGAPSIHDYAKFALARLDRCRKMKVRTEVPPVMEIEATKMLQPVLVRVYFLDGTFETMPVTSTTGPIDLKNMTCELLGVSAHNSPAFGIYEVYPNNEERLIQEHERILDVVAFWQRIFEDTKQREGKDANRELPNRFVLKVQQYNTLKHKPSYDHAAERLMYIQAVYDVVCDRYPCSEEQCMELAPFQRQAEAPGKPVEPSELGRYLKRAIVATKSSANLFSYAREINKALDKLKTKTPRECRKLYLEKVQKWKIYGSSFFVVNPMDPTRYGGEDTTLFLAINPKGIMIIRPETKELVSEMPFTRVPTWGFSNKAFVLQVGTLIHSEKHTFGTSSGAEMNQLVRAYVQELLQTKEET